MEWIRNLAEEARQRVGIIGEPTDEELDRVAEMMGVRVVYSEVPCPFCVHTSCGPMIVRPLQWRDEHGNPYGHELGHAVTHPGGGNVIRLIWPNSPRHERLAALWTARDELYAEEFAKALRGR